MLQGQYDLKLYDTPGFSEADLNSILGPKDERKHDAVLPLLESWGKPQQVGGGKNLVFDNWAGFCFVSMMNGGDITDYYDYGGTANAYFAQMSLVQSTSEPTYQEWSAEWFLNWDTYSGNNGSGTTKRFIEDEVEAHLIQTDPTGREAITTRHRWLWLPSQAVSPGSISSVVTRMASDGDGGSASGQTGVASRIRLKDSGGNPITINKQNTQTLFVEYQLTFVAV